MLFLMGVTLMKGSKIACAVAAAAMTCAGNGALAYEAGDFIGRVGVATVAPHEDSDAIIIPTSPATVLPDGVGLDSDTQLGLAGTYMLTSHIGVEILAATPFRHTIKLADIDVTAGSAKHLPPTLSLQYYPLDAKSAWQPYVGAGLNYTTFFSEDVHSELNATLASVLGVASVDAELKLDDSWGIALEAGVDYRLTEQFGINVAVWWVDIDTRATVSVGATDVKFDVDIDPWVYMIGAVYKF
jgi:outer membrane protein